MKLTNLLTESGPSDIPVDLLDRIGVVTKQWSKVSKSNQMDEETRQQLEQLFQDLGDDYHSGDEAFVRMGLEEIESVLGQ